MNNDSLSLVSVWSLFFFFGCLSYVDIPLAKLPDTLIDALKAMGHSIKLRRPPYPSVNIATRIGDSVVSYSDSRGGGYAVKYGP